MRRAIENVEVACGIPMMMQGYNLEDVARGIDEMMIRQPLGVVAAIVPFNFPGMIPFWFLPYAIATGNTFILKPSSACRSPCATSSSCWRKSGLPKGVVNLVNGGKAVVNALLDHPKVRAISFVGSTPVARYIYARSGENGKRCQCQGGAKNHVIVLPDADMQMATQIISDSAFGCAGQRCLAVSVAVTIGEAQKTFRDSITERGCESPSRQRPRRRRADGSGDYAAEQRAGRIADRSRREARRKSSARRPQLEDSELRVGKLREADDSRRRSRDQRTRRHGNLRSSAQPRPRQQIWTMRLRFLERSAYGNQASLFTSSGAAARRFRYEAPAGNIGINIGVAAPMAYFPFSGWKDSFFGICTPRAATPSSSIPKRRSWSSAGPKSTPASSRNLKRRDH